MNKFIKNKIDLTPKRKSFGIDAIREDVRTAKQPIEENIEKESPPVETKFEPQSEKEVVNSIVSVISNNEPKSNVEEVVKVKKPSETKREKKIKTEDIDTSEKRGRGRPKKEGRGNLVRHTIYIDEKYLSFFQNMASLSGKDVTLTDVLNTGFAYLYEETPEEDRKRIEREMKKEMLFFKKFESQKRKENE